jgi:hypothetical protein
MMAVELEQTVMREIGLGNHYSWFNGSGACGHIARKAVDSLPKIAQKNGLTISKAWLAKCNEAIRADAFDSSANDQYRVFSLTNVWVTCSYAIQDAIYRMNGGEGFTPANHTFQFFHSERRKAWEQRNSAARTGSLLYGFLNYDEENDDG